MVFPQSSTIGFAEFRDPRNGQSQLGFRQEFMNIFAAKDGNAFFNQLKVNYLDMGKYVSVSNWKQVKIFLQSLCETFFQCVQKGIDRKLARVGSQDYLQVVISKDCPESNWLVMSVMRPPCTAGRW